MSELNSEKKELEIKNVIKVGLISPISRIEELDSQHWINLRKILQEALDEVSDFTFELSLVSDSESSNVIIGRIIENIFQNEIIICDASCLNPNVMFELGLRLSTQKPTILIKDTETKFIFDTGTIEHVEYPRSLHYTAIQGFKTSLANKISTLYKKYLEKTTYKSFLDYFGKYNVSELKTVDVNLHEYIDARFSDLSSQISHQLNGIRFPTNPKVNAREQIAAALLENRIMASGGLLGAFPNEALKAKIADIVNEVSNQLPGSLRNYSISEVTSIVDAKIPENYRIFSTPSEINELILSELISRP